MKESIAMQELRRIRDENSLRHRSMTWEEIAAEEERSVKWFEEKLGRSIPVVSTNPKRHTA